MADDNPPKPLNEIRERREQSKRIAAQLEQISMSVRDLSGQMSSLVTEIKASKKKPDASEDKYRKSDLRWTKIDVISTSAFAALALVLSALTLFILNNQLRTMRIDQRAWINVSADWQEVVENKPLKVIARTLNVGKTPAKRIEQRFVVEKRDKQQAPTLNFSTWHITNNAGIMMPNVPSTTDVFMLTEQKRTPGDPPTPTKADIEDFRNGKAYMVFYGVTTYVDIYDIEHWVRSCVWYGMKYGELYPARGCTEYNGTDTN